MKKFLPFLIVVMVAVVNIPAAEAEEFFKPQEKEGICAVIAEVFPGAGVVFNDTCTGNVGILIGPLATGEFIFVFTKASGEVFFYQPSVKYRWATLQIAKAIHLTMDFWDAQRALGPGPKELQEVKK